MAENDPEKAAPTSRDFLIRSALFGTFAAVLVIVQELIGSTLNVSSTLVAIATGILVTLWLAVGGWLWMRYIQKPRAALRNDPPLEFAESKRHPDPLRPWIQLFATGFAVLTVAIVLWALLAPR